MIELSNGYKIPDICYGTGIVWDCRYEDGGELRRIYREKKYIVNNFLHNRKQIKKDNGFIKAIETAMDCGCNLFDTSSAYAGAEYYLGKTLRKYKRSDYFICDKVKNYDQYHHNVREAFEKSLKELGTDYLDIYLLHWPVEGIFEESWKELERLYEEKLVKAIGVSNFNIHHLKKLENKGNIRPLVNEFECHPLFTQNELRDYCRENKIQVMAYTATARGDERIRKTAISDLAQKYNKTINQIIIRWHQQVGNIPIINSYNSLHVMENCMMSDFFLNREEIDTISSVNINSRLRYDPDNCDFTKL